MQRLIYMSARAFVFFLQDSEGSFLVCYSSPFLCTASVPANGAVFEFIEVIVPWVWSAALSGQVPASLGLHREKKGPSLWATTVYNISLLRGVEQSSAGLELYSLHCFYWLSFSFAFIENLVFQS